MSLVSAAAGAATDRAADEPPPEGPDALGASSSLTRKLMLGLGLLVVAATCGAAYNNSQVLLVWDEPIQEFVEANRTEALTRAMSALTALGHQNIIIPTTALFVAITWRRCRIAAVVLLALTVARVVIHLGLKDGIARDRPSLDPLVSAAGNSYPSGHVMSAVLIWGLAPFIVGLLTRRRYLWYATAAFAALAMAASTISRTYLGAHWFSDSVIGFVIGVVLLVAAYTGIRRHHRGQVVAPGRLGLRLLVWAPPSSCRTQTRPVACPADKVG